MSAIDRLIQTQFKEEQAADIKPFFLGGRYFVNTTILFSVLASLHCASMVAGRGLAKIVLGEENISGSVRFEDNKTIEVYPVYPVIAYKLR